jgi:uncharacterized protein (TIGR04255 family)
MMVSDGTAREGVALDLDAVRNLNATPTKFADELSEVLEDTHSKLKSIFFSCLTEKALASLEPTYE